MTDSDKAYDPSLIEDKWYSFWQTEGFFKADHKSQKEPYTVVLPPPNVTGALHMGHALVDTLQDVLIRRKRMQGYEALWLPGTDHAGISTQSVVERHLYEKTGKKRCDFSRAEFLAEVWLWKEEYEKRILGQLKKVGCSLDWSRLRFTMDDRSNLAVRTAFKKMFDDDLIYQGDYLVNWDPILQTAIADDEVEHEDKHSFLWYLRYPIEGTKEQIVIATTRPETMLADTAVAISPKDERYSHLVGKFVLLPLMNRKIPIIEDSFVDPSFGTGCVKITPAHDFNDYEMGARHNLPLINIMSPDGSINENGGEFQGLTMHEARSAVVEKMKSLNLIEKIVAHENRVGVSYRSKAIIEPYLSKQWFIKMTPFKEKLIAIVAEDKVKIVPDYWKKTYFHWIENLRDWCISRQLWWGHRIPIWYHKTDKTKMICHSGDDLPKEVAQNPDDWEQDHDVLDTWFSSALWPMTTLGWPENTGDLDKFYPTSTLITGHDILFFWVARMILMGDYFKKEVPFHETFIHGLIYGKSYWRVDHFGRVSYTPAQERLSYEMGKEVPSDVHSKWEKMSKSKGNVIDPIEIIEQYGADAMRLALCASVTHARQIDLDRRRFEEYKNFANKIWNASRFIFLNLDSLSTEEFASGLNPTLFTLDDRWLLSRLNYTIKEVNSAFDRYDFDEATKLIYTFFWDQFCAYYLELCKPYFFGKAGSLDVKANKQKLLLISLVSLIRLMHPIAPFITEELFSKCRGYKGSSSTKDPYTKETLLALSFDSITIAPYPTPILSDISPACEEEFSLLNDIIYAIRNIRAEMQIPLKTAVDVFFSTENPTALSLVEKEKTIITALVKIQTLDFTGKLPPSPSATALIKGLTITIPLPPELKEKEKERLTKELQKETLQIESLQKRLQDSNFTARAPEELVAKTKLSLLEAENKAKELQEKLISI